MYQFNDLCLEVTRRCNMSCEHCLRGCAQNVDMSKETVDILLSNTDSIGNITFTGGEPVLNAELIIYTIDQIMFRQISVGSFFMVTNAGVFNKDLFFKLIEFYHYCDEKEYSNVAISFDNYHDGADHQIIDWWKSLTFYSDVKDQSENYSFNNNLISEGAAHENGIGSRELTIDDEFEIEDSSFLSMTYINVNGDIVNNCDMSYETQEEHILGSVFNLHKLVETYSQEECYA